MRIYLVALAALIVISGCGIGPQVPLEPKLSQYEVGENQCRDFLDGKIILNNTIEKECKLFLQRLEVANNVGIKLKSGKLKKGEAIETKILYNRERNKVRLAYEKLSDSIKDATLVTIKNDETEKFLKGIAFPGNTFIDPYYQYMKSKAPRFDQHPLYLKYKKEESERLRLKGDAYLKKGAKKKALQLYTQAANMDNAKAAYATALMYEKTNQDLAIEWYEKAAKGGVINANLHLGSIYIAKGDRRTALAYFLKAAKNNNPVAQYKLYQFYAGSDEPRALTWLKKSIAQDYAPAQYSYARYLLKQDKQDQAIDMLEKASTSGYDEATIFLAHYYYDLKLYPRTAKVLKRSKNAESLALQAKMYEVGAGVIVDYNKAYDLYEQTLHMGRKESQKDLARVSALMSTAQKLQNEARQKERAEEAAKMVKECGVIPAPELFKIITVKKGKKRIKKAKNKNIRVHLTGIASAPIGRDFVIYGDDGEDYYVQNTKGIQEEAHVDISAIYTGTTATMTDVNEDKEEIPQFTYSKKCIIEKEQ